MSLRTACTSCGKKLQVRDELEGKKVKCPGCGTVFLAAAAESGSSAVKASDGRSAPPAAKDRVSAKPMAKKPALPPVEYDDEEDDEEMEERPARSRGNARREEEPAGSGMMFLWIGLTVVLLAGAAVGGYFLFFSGPTTTPVVQNNKGPNNVNMVNPNGGMPGPNNPMGMQGGAVQGGPVQGGPVQGGPNQGGPVASGPIINKPPMNSGVQVKTPPPPVVKGFPAPAMPVFKQVEVPKGALTLAELIPADSLFFGSVSGELWNAQALAELKSKMAKEIETGFQQGFGIPLSEIERISLASLVSAADLKNTKEPPVVLIVQTKSPVNQQAVWEAVWKWNFGPQQTPSIEFLSEQTVAVATSGLGQSYKNKRGKQKAGPELEKALAQATSSKGVVVYADLPKDLQAEAQQAPPQFLQIAGPFLKATNVFGKLDLDDKLRLSLTVTLEDAAAAGEAKKAAEGLVALGGFVLEGMAKDANAAPFAKLGKQALSSLKITQQDKALVAAIEMEAAVLLADLLPAVQKVREAAGSAQESNNLKQIALAFHQHHDTMGSLPPQTVGKGLSWRVAILPYIEQDQLYRQFKLDEPWDSPTNKKLISLMPKLYESPGKKAAAGQTYYQIFVGPNTMNKDVKKGMKLQQIPDGTSNTLLVAEAAEAVEWTKPADIQVAPTQPVMLGGGPAGPWVAYADGSVRRLPRNLDPSILRLLIDPADGMPIPNFDAPPGKK